MPKIYLKGQEVEYRIRRSKRAKYPRIDVDLKGIMVVIPEQLNLSPEKFLEEKSNWVIEKYNKVLEYWSRVPDRNFEEGEKFPFLGDEYVIEFTSNDSQIKDGKILVSKQRAEKKGTKEVIEEMYREKIREKIKNLIAEYEDHIKGDYDKLYIRNQKTKWASCSSKKNLSFNWRLLMAPEDVIEYVVVHELIHIDEPNHSDHFWYKLHKLLPDFKRRRKWLEENSPELVVSEEDLI